RAPGRRHRPAAGRLPRGADPALPGRAAAPGRRPPHGPHPRQRQKPLGTGAGEVTPLTGGRVVNPPDTDPTGDFVTPAGSEPGGSGEAEDPRVTRAVEEYLAAVRAGRRPERQAFLADHAEVAGELAECLEGLEFIQAAAPRFQCQAWGVAVPPDAGAPDPS